MYHQFSTLEKSNIDIDQMKLQKWIAAGNWIMIISFLVVTGCLLITFGFEHNFSIASQIAGHISTIISAAFLKVGYVLRCVGTHGLGIKVF